MSSVAAYPQVSILLARTMIAARSKLTMRFDPHRPLHLTYQLEQWLHRLIGETGRRALVRKTPTLRVPTPAYRSMCWRSSLTKISGSVSVRAPAVVLNGFLGLGQRLLGHRSTCCVDMPSTGRGRQGNLGLPGVVSRSVTAASCLGYGRWGIRILIRAKLIRGQRSKGRRVSILYDCSTTRQ